MPLLGFGFALIILYLSFAMGRFNWIEQRVINSHYSHFFSGTKWVDNDYENQVKRLMSIYKIHIYGIHHYIDFDYI